MSIRCSQLELQLNTYHSNIGVWKNMKSDWSHQPYPMNLELFMILKFGFRIARAGINKFINASSNNEWNQQVYNLGCMEGRVCLASGGSQFIIWNSACTHKLRGLTKSLSDLKYAHVCNNLANMDLNYACGC